MKAKTIITHFLDHTNQDIKVKVVVRDRSGKVTHYREVGISYLKPSVIAIEESDLFVAAIKENE
jgi:hypothetical protein